MEKGNDDMTAILFTRSASPYLTGDKAVFSAAKAEEYVRAGKAQYVDRQMTTNRAMSAGDGQNVGSAGLDPAKAKPAPSSPKKGKPAKRKRLGD